MFHSTEYTNYVKTERNSETLHATAPTKKLHSE